MPAVVMPSAAMRGAGAGSVAPRQLQPLCPLSFAPGEAYQFDWSHEVVLLSRVTVIVKAAHVRLCHSRMLFVRAYARYYNETRTHLALDKDAPLSRTVKRAGRILCRPILGGLHHEYVRI
jgi:hypothetical protein